MVRDAGECFDSTARGYTMPAFMFEKISPPVHRGPVTPVIEKPQGVISQMIGRFAERRAKPGLGAERSVTYRDEKPTE